MVKKKCFPNLIFKAFDGLHYPFPAESFDLIVTRYAFHHFPNISDVIGQMYKLTVQGGRVLVSDPMRNEKDDTGIIDSFMRVKKDGHIRFYSACELEELFFNHGFTKEKQTITEMKFPFPEKAEYVEIYDTTTEKEQGLYGITNENGVVWVRHINIGNTVFVKV